MVFILFIIMNFIISNFFIDEIYGLLLNMVGFLD